MPEVGEGDGGAVEGGYVVAKIAFPRASRASVGIETAE